MIMKPKLSDHFLGKSPSAIRLAQIEFGKRTDRVEAVNVAIGNVSLPMHPVMQNRMRLLSLSESPFREGVVRYTVSVGTEEANRAVLNIIGSSRFETDGLFSQITDGGSSAMELVILGVCGPAGSGERPLLVFEPVYTNYIEMAQRVGRRVVSVVRRLDGAGRFRLPEVSKIETVIEKEKPGAMLVIPYDNPSGAYYSQEELNTLARLCVKHNLWLVGDEAYRELHYEGDREKVKGESSRNKPASVWGIGESKVPGITGRRISVESASKVWNACGLRIGALVTDNKKFHEQAVAEYTTNLCPNAIGQYIFGALADEGTDELQEWYEQQREYYRALMTETAEEIRQALPKAVVSSPDAAIYLVVDVKDVVDKNFEMGKFVLWCAREGKVKMGEKWMTLLVAPMRGFYGSGSDVGRTQMRIACVESSEKMELVAELLGKLLREYLG